MVVSALKKLLFAAMAGLIAMALIACITLYYLTGTTSGSRALLLKAQEYLKDSVSIDAEITEGSFLFGFRSARPISVVVPDVVSVTADSIDLKYNVFDVITKNALVIENLTAPNLKVKLIESAADTSEESADTDDYDSFRLHIPVHIVVKKLQSTDFAYLSEIVDVKVGNADLSLDVKDDFAGVTGGVAQDVAVQLHDEIWADEQEEPSPKVHVMTFDGGGADGRELIEKLGPIPLPLNASISNLKIKNGRYFMTVYDTGLFDAEVSAFWSGTLLQVRKVHVDHKQLGEVTVNGSLDFVDYFNFDFSLSGAGKRNSHTSSLYDGALYALKGEGTLKGNLTDLSLRAALNEPQRLNVKARLNTLSDDLPCELKVIAESFRYPMLYVAASQVSSDELSPAVIAVTDDSWQRTSDMSQVRDADDEDPKIEYLTEDKNGIKAELDGLYLNLKGSIMNGMATVMSGKFSGYGFDNTNVDLKAFLGIERSQIDSLSLEGAYEKTVFTAGYSGVLDYESCLSAEGNLSLKSPDMGPFRKELKGRFDSQAVFSSSYDPADDFVSFAVRDLSSSFALNGDRVSCEGKNIEGSLFVNGEQTDISIAKLTLKHSDNYLDLTGNLSENSRLTATIKMEDLSDVDKELKGQLNAHLNITGSYLSPNVEFVGTSKYLSVGDFRALNLAVNSTLNMEREKANIAVIADSVIFSPELKASRKCALDLSGTLQSHRLSLNCGGNNGGFISTVGSYDRSSGVLKGQIKDLLFVSEFSDPVSLKKPIAFRVFTENTVLNEEQNDDLFTAGEEVSSFSGSIEAFELSSKQFGDLEVSEIVFSNDSLHTSVRLGNLPLDGFSRYLPQNSRLDGTVSVSADVDVEAGIPHIRGTLSSSSGNVHLPEFNIGYQSVKIDTDLDSNKARAKLEVMLSDNNGSLSTEIIVNDPSGKKALEGSIMMNDLDLDLFEPLSSNFNELYGKANVKGSLSGSLGTPLFNGRITIKGRAEPYYDVGSVNSFNLSVDASGTGGQLSGQIKLNEGELKLGGTLDWSDNAKASVTLDGDNLPVFLLGYGVANTNVHTRAVLDKSLDISGRIDIPSASIVVEGLDSSVTYPSADEIIVGKNGSQALIKEKMRKKSGLDTSISVDVNIGSNVNLRAMGLKAQVVGGVKIRKKITDDTVNGYGTVSLEHGVADLYGHHFLVNYANTVFNGNIAHPKLGAEIIADPSGLDNNVIVGIKAVGDVADPHIELFSKPSMSENEIMSYLLYGHGLDKSSGSSSDGSAQLLMALGLGTTTGMINSVATAFGMHSVQVGSSGTGDETQFGIQGYLTKDIRLSYGYGLFTSVGEFSLRYELMRRLYVEFVSSIGQAVDLIYSFEFD